MEGNIEGSKRATEEELHAGGRARLGHWRFSGGVQVWIRYSTWCVPHTDSREQTEPQTHNRLLLRTRKPL